jgi:hypothetical protein
MSKLSSRHDCQASQTKDLEAQVACVGESKELLGRLVACYRAFAPQACASEEQLGTYAADTSGPVPGAPPAEECAVLEELQACGK